MRRSLAAASLAVVTTVTALGVAAPAGHASVGDVDLVQRWAPVLYQDVDDSDADADYLSRMDFDGDWDMRDNWENQEVLTDQLTGAAYYSVSETATHWFIVYAYFHPRDWVDWWDPFNIDHHENDLEGVLLTVRKDGTTYGALEGMITVAHTHFWSYTPPGSPFVDGGQSVDGEIIMQNVDGFDRPTIEQEAKGHGIYAWSGEEFPGGDGIVYHPGGHGELPDGGNDRSVSYELIDLFGPGQLWDHRGDSRTFASEGALAGDDGKDNAAMTPWRWDDSDDGDHLQRGLIGLDPAYLVSNYFDGTGDFATEYTRMPYVL